jgi:dipeptidyl aminopeptidase/acylaminoacyl peptidase
MPSRVYRSAIHLTLLSQLVLSACGADAPLGPVDPVPETPIAAIRVNSPSPTLYLGGTTQLSAVALSATGAELPGRQITWASEYPEQAIVNVHGQVQGLGLGEAVIWASSGAVSEKVELMVVPAPIEYLVLSISSVELVEGDSVQVTAEVRNEEGAVVPNRVIALTSLNPTAAPIVAGWVRAAREGVATLRATSGVLVATATVTVQRELGGDLFLVSTDVDEGGPRVYRSDLRDGPASIVPWQATGLSKHPRVSPDGSRVAYTCHESETTRGSAICIANLNGTNVQVLTAGDGYYEDEPTWSPDGSRIAFRRWVATFGWPGWTIPTDIWTMDATGGDQVNLTNDSTSQHEPAWSPVQVNGSYRIAFVEEEIVNHQRRTWVASMRTDGSERRNETTGAPRVEQRPTWSPDGTRLLFTRAPLNAMPELWVLDVAAGTSQRFLPYALGGGQLSPAWSPDGQHIAFSSAHDAANGNDWQVYTVRVDGSRLVRRTSGGAGRGQLEWVATP